MRKNFLLFFTLIASFIFTLIVGVVFSSEGRTLRINQRIIKEIQQTLANFQKNSVLPSLKISPSEIPGSSAGAIDSLARCLSDSHFVMYGTAGCSACGLQREYFGQSFALIRYIDCSKEKEFCAGKNIHSYPTWEDQKENRYKGVISLEVLAQLSNCPFSK